VLSLVQATVIVLSLVQATVIVLSLVQATVIVLSFVQATVIVLSLVQATVIVLSLVQATDIVLSSATNVHSITTQDRALATKSLSHHAGDADAGARAGICNGVRDGSERDRITSCHHHLQHTTATLRQRRDCKFTRRHHPVDRRLLLAARCFVWCWWLPGPSPSRLRGWTSSEMRVPI
jgi:hypothetical protein